MQSDAAGFTLVEVLISTIVLAMVAAGIMGVIASTGRGRVEDESRLAAAQAGDSLRSALRDYTVAWPQSGEPLEQDLATLDTALVGVAGCTSRCRVLPGDNCPWALALDCKHNATGLLPPSLSQPPKSAAMTYEVSASSDGSRTAMISISWKR